jgi:hypothetical protein
VTVEKVQRITLLLVLALALALAGSAFATVQRVSAGPAWTKNCTALHKRFPHGVGKLSAHDRTKSGDPVTNFRRSTRLYNLAMSYNKRLDADKDGVACEKH